MMHSEWDQNLLVLHEGLLFCFSMPRFLGAEYHSGYLSLLIGLVDVDDVSERWDDVDVDGAK